MKNFDWDKFKNEKIAVWCDTEEKAKDFFEQAIKQGLTWRGETPLEETSWKSYESDTSYIVYRDIFGEIEGLQFSPIEYYRDRKGYKIIKWELDEMENLKDILTAGRSVELRNGDVYRIFGKFSNYDTILASVKNDKWINLQSFDNGLTHKHWDSEFDIMLINECPDFAFLMTEKIGHMIWQRQELTPEQKKIEELKAIIENVKKELEKMEGVE